MGHVLGRPFLLWTGVFDMLNKNIEISIGKTLSLEWIGQTLASLCWIVSVFVYEISEIGDWLQLIAASCWMISNIAAVFSIRG